MVITCTYNCCCDLLHDTHVSQTGRQTQIRMDECLPRNGLENCKQLFAADFFFNYVFFQLDWTPAKTFIDTRNYNSNNMLYNLCVIYELHAKLPLAVNDFMR
ncbi:hypothetical protein GQX74_014358 [Glossina fuscipes]|nr:hypothetical protein GQX74_014358 [Glossina fuscipes]